MHRPAHDTQEGPGESVHANLAEVLPTVAVATEVQATIFEPAPPVVPPVTTLVSKRTTVDWIIDYAKTDRCECHRSGEVIGRDELRVMRRNTASTGFQMAYSYKVVPFFQMMSRMAAATSKPATAAGLVGFGELSAADQQMLDSLFRRYQDPSDDFPPAEAKGQCAAAIRKHRRPQLERRFLCPAPGCTKAYSSAGCLSQHKRDKHPELLRGRLRGPGDGCPHGNGPAANLALAPPEGAAAAASTAPTLTATPATFAPLPADQPQVTAQGVPAPLTATSVDSTATYSLEEHSYAPASQQVMPPVLPPVMVAALAPHAEPPRAAAFEPEPPLPPRKLQCPAPGCDKAYACSSSLYVHKRNKHPELIRPRGNQTARPEMAGAEMVGAELIGAVVTGVAGVEMVSVSVEMGGEVLGGEVLGGEVLGGEVLGASAEMGGAGGMGGGIEMLGPEACADAEMTGADDTGLAGGAMAGAEGMGDEVLGGSAEMLSSLAASAEMTGADHTDMATPSAEGMGDDAVYAPS